MNRLEADSKELTTFEKKKIMSVVIFSYPFGLVLPFGI